MQKHGDASGIRGAGGAHDYVVVDAHQHLAADPSRDKADLDARRQFMEKFGISRTYIMPCAVNSEQNIGQEIGEINTRVQGYCEMASTLVLGGLGVVNVRAKRQDLERQVRTLIDLGLKGVVWHHMFLGEFLDSPGTVRALELCCEYHLPVFVHVIAASLLESMWRLGRLCRLVPEVTIVALDGLSSPHHGMNMVEFAYTHANVIADTGVLASYGNLIEEFVRVNGDDRLIFGSDYSVDPKPFSVPYALLEVLECDLGQESKSKMLSGNIERIFKSSK